MFDTSTSISFQGTIKPIKFRYNSVVNEQN